MKKLTLILVWLPTVILFSAEPTTYYNGAEGESANNLRYALQDIIDGHTNVGYDGLYNVYETSDLTADGKVWDMYSTCTWTHGQKKCGNYKNVCDCYNREHSVPQSWFNSSSPMVSDAFHVYPTDGKVNGQRSNYQFGECATGTSLGSNALGKAGSSSFSGYSGTVFEPDDQYKGDFARSYFYMATRYADKCTSWGNSFGSTSGLSNYSVALFLKWHRQDPVSSKEITRNEAVYAKQRNRNPFIDYPELAEYIWGTKKSETWYKSSTPIEQTPFQHLVIYPNPAKDVVTIASELGEALHYRILNLAGQIVMDGSTVSGSSISVSGLMDGIYLLETQANGKAQLVKLLIAN